MNRFARILLGASMGVLIALTAGVGVASAHAELLSSDPQPGAQLDAAPAAITLTFTEPVEISLGAIRLFDGSGTPITLDAARHPGGRAEVVTVDVPQLAEGSYVVDWRVVSTDSHPIHAAFSFQIGQTSTLQAGLVDSIVDQGATGAAAGRALTTTRGMVVAAIAVVFGGLLVCGLGIAPFERRQRRVIGVAALIGTVAGLSALPLEVGYTAGRSLGVITDWSAWRAVLDSRIGVAWTIRALVIGSFATLLLFTRRRSSSEWWRQLVVIGLIIVAAASAYGGHGSVGRWRSVAVLATVLHVSAMAVWIGGLAVMLLGIGTATRAQVTRFSALALVCVAVVVVSGAVQGVRQVGSLDALTSTSYGRLLIWKLVGIAVILLLAGVSRVVVHGRLFGGAAAASEEVDSQRLRRTVATESLVAVGIISVTALLMATNPSQAAAAVPFSSTLTSTGYLAEVNISPARVGANGLHLLISSPAGGLDQPDAVTVTIDDPSRDVDPITIDVSQAGGGHYTNEAASFPYPATWQLLITARFGFEQVQFSADVKIV